jgi:hypothetical protein
MNFRTATLLVLGMFGSFAVVITTMLVLFWHPDENRAAENARKHPEVALKRGENPGHATSAPNAPAVKPESQSDGQAEPMSQPAEESPPDVSQTTLVSAPATSNQPAETTSAQMAAVAKPSAGHTVQKTLQVELEEMKLLREEMERRLQAHVDMRARKLDQLAKQCGNLQAGEAVQILVAYDDTLIQGVLEKMEREKAIQIAALLKRLGRGNAISIK